MLFASYRVQAGNDGADQKGYQRFQIQEEFGQSKLFLDCVGKFLTLSLAHGGWKPVLMLQMCSTRAMNIIDTPFN